MGEGVSSGVLVVDFSNFDSIVGQEVVHKVGDVGADVEFKHLSVIFQELFGGVGSTSSEFVFHIVLHEVVFVDGFLVKSFLSPVVLVVLFGEVLGLSDIFVEFTGIDITVIDVNILSKNGNVSSYFKVFDSYV